MSTKAIDRAVPLYPILSVNFIGTLGFGIVLPFLVFLVSRFGGNALIYGLIGATYSLFQLLGAPVLGRWSDTYGRRKILLLSQAGTFVSWGLFLGALFLPVATLTRVESSALGSFTVTLPLLALFVARALDGLTGGNVSVANAYLADITEESQRTANFGKMAVAGNLGFVLGPALAGLLGGTAWGETAPVVAALLISGVATLVIALKLPESLTCVLRADPELASTRKMLGQDHGKCFTVTSDERVTVWQALARKGVPTLAVMIFLTLLGFNFFYIAFPVYAMSALSWTVTQVGAFFAVLGLLMAVVQGPLLSWASARWRSGSLVLVGSVTLALSFALFSSSRWEFIYLGAALLAVGNGLMWPSVMSLVSVAAGERLQGAVQGAIGSVGGVASIVGLVVGGMMYERLQGQVFLLSALLIGAVVAMSFQQALASRWRASES
ncbi:MFS transporter [Candidatus Poribacteria bacterium]|jgi:MFS transporter, DHA1 family, tetracycline resistance protein|nr:MFS transporter [Candidatus Poribacteria bacterium]MBT5534855.1 MFS transporter [Candidatus Poribacteria bacterium]MBT5711468.1 MFS transporter [Candidatus Poribacteria bacterium]MBT7100928.1 MFS transporter [Candidatus Poribacteria bacterium]MBT7805375.1 MFS transporter [Candidatus Poribacteria bacterium]